MRLHSDRLFSRFFPGLSLCVALLFTSCFEIAEEFTVTGSGSGEYVMHIDMHKMVAMLSSLGDSAASGKSINTESDRDTVIYFRENIDQSNDLDKTEKALLQDASMKMRVSLRDEELYFRFIFPFSDGGALTKLYNLLPKAMQNLKLDSLDEKEEAGENGVQAKPSAEMAAANPYFTVRTGNGFFEKTLDEAAWMKHAAKDSAFMQMAQLFGSTYITTVVRLPAPVKNCSHPFAVIAGDRRSVTLKFSIADYMERPEVLSYRIEY